MQKILAFFMLSLLLTTGLFFSTSTFNAVAATVSRTYSINKDFNEGIFIGVSNTQVEDQLQLSQEQETLPFIWVANSGESTVSKINTITGEEIGRYRTGPGIGEAENPSRTTVDLNGDLWVGNRNTNTAVKIALNPFDLDGDGVLKTSTDINNNGLIDPAEILPWGMDEAVLMRIPVDSGPRALAIDAHNNVWIGGYGQNMGYYDGQTGTLLKNIYIGRSCYGALIDDNGTLWVSNHTYNSLTRIDNPDAGTPVNSSGAHSINFIPADGMVYGITIDIEGYIYTSGLTYNRLRKFDPMANSWVYQISIPGGSNGRGMAVDLAGDVWVAQSNANTVTRHDSYDGSLKATINVGNHPTGIALDSAGKIWVTNRFSDNIMRIDPDWDSIELTLNGHFQPYNYSDMTGIIVRNITAKTGTWTIVLDSESDNTPWGTLSWTCYEPSGTSVFVKVRSSNNRSSWSTWQPASKGIAVSAPLNGRYLEIMTTLQITAGDLSPILHNLTVKSVNRPPVLNQISDRMVKEQELLQFTLSATDPDEDDLTYSVGNLPPGASFNPVNQTFTWIPGYHQEGSYQVIFTIADDDQPPETISETITITVEDVNRSPVLDPIGNKKTHEKQTLQFTVNATDPDGDALTYSTGRLPSRADFDPGTHTFAWSPSYDQEGSYQVTFTIADNGQPQKTDSETITIIVKNENRPPVLDRINDKTVDVEKVLKFTLDATDPDDDYVTYSAGNLPPGASFDPDTQIFSWRPNYNQQGKYSDIIFEVSDDDLDDHEEITITVRAINPPPVINPPPNNFPITQFPPQTILPNSTNPTIPINPFSSMTRAPSILPAAPTIPPLPGFGANLINPIIPISPIFPLSPLLPILAPTLYHSASLAYPVLPIISIRPILPMTALLLLLFPN